MRTGCIIFVLLIAASHFVHAADATTQPTTQPAAPSLFRDPVDGAFDVSNFLSTQQGFLPIAVPITEPAVGYGLSPGLSFFHDKPQAINRPSASAPTPA